MPQVIPAFAAAVSAVAGAAATVGFAIGGATGGLIASNFVSGFLTLGAIGGGVGAAVGGALGTAALLGVMSSKPSVPSTGLQTQVVKDPLAPRWVAMGRTAVAGNMTACKTHGPNGKHRSYVLSLSQGPVTAITGLKLGDENLTWDGSGNVGGRWTNRMRVYTRLGSWDQTAISLPVPPWGDSPVPEWTAAHRLRGVAHVWWAVEFDQKLINGLSNNPLWIVEDYAGADLIDPRTGTTATGAARRLPAVWAYSLLLGFRSPITGYVWLGYNHPASEIDTAAYAALAASDALLGRTVSGLLTAGGDLDAQLAAILAASGAVPIDRGGLQSVMPGTAKTSVMTITEAMIAGGGVVQQVLNDPSARPNSVVPTYRSEANGWQMVAAEAVEDAAYIAADGGRVQAPMQLDYVADVNQAAQLAALGLVHAREERIWRIAGNRALMQAAVGQAVTLNLPSAGLVGVKGVVERKVQSAAGEIGLEVRSETDAKYTWALTRTGAAPSTAVISQEAGVPQPDAGVWAPGSVLLTQPGSAGAQIPVLRVSGTVETPLAERVVVSYRIAGDTAWTDWPSVERAATGATVIDVSGLRPGTVYQSQVSYIDVRGVRGAPRVLADVTLAALRAGQATQIVNPGAGAGGTDIVIPGSSVQASLDEIAAARRTFGTVLASIEAAEDNAVAEVATETAVARTVGPNLVRNGGFADLSGWAGAGAVAGVSGDRRFVGFTGAGYRVVQSEPIPVSANAWYSAAGLLFAAAGNRCRLFVQFYTDAGGTSAVGGAPVIGSVTGVDWTRVFREDRSPSTRIQAPATAVSARLFVDNFRDTGAGETYPASPNIGATEIVFARGDRAPRFGQEQAEGSFAARVLSGQLAAGADLNAVALRTTTVEGQINTPTTGLLAKVGILESIAVSPTGAVATQGTEISAARDGAASLAARFLRDVVAAVDGESVSAATAVQRLTASRDQPNILVNGSFAARRSLAATSSQIAVSGATPAAHVSGWFQSAGIGWIGETDLAGYRVALYNGGGTSYVTSPRSPAAAFVAHSASLEIAAGGHASQTTRFFLNWINISGSVISSTGWSTSSTTLAGAGTYQRIVLENVVSPSGTAFVEMVIEIALPTGESAFRFVRLRRAKVNVGATATRWGDEATIVDVMRAALDGDALSASAETVLNVLGATSSIRQTAMTKLRDETAFVELLAAAGGGLPALFRLVARSTPGGATFSEIIQAATRLIFRNTAGTATIEAMRIEDGIVKVLNALWIGTGTVPPLRLEPTVPALIATLGSYKVMFGALGPGGAQMVLWFGPSSISDFSVTRTNGAFALGTDGVVYYGTSPLATGGSGAKGQKTSNNNGTSGASTLVAQVTINDAPTGTVDISKSKYECVSGTGTASFRPRVTRQFGSGTEADFAIGFSDELISGGTPAIGVNIADFFQNTFNPTTAGTVTYRLYMDRTAGTGSISTSDCVFSVEQWPN